MSMSVGPASDEASVMASINTTPLVDVMLGLRIIFLITMPVNTRTSATPENITIAVDKDGNIYWNDKRVADRSALLGFIKEAAVRKPQPEIHIRGDKDTRYEAIGRVMYAIQRGGVQKVGFLTEPDRGVPVY